MATGPKVILDYPEKSLPWPREYWADRSPRPIYTVDPAPVVVTPAPVMVSPEQNTGLLGQLTGTQLAIGVIILILLLKK